MNARARKKESAWNDVIDSLITAFGTVLLIVPTDPPDSTAGWIAVTLGALLVGAFTTGLRKIIRLRVPTVLQFLKELLRRFGPVLLVTALTAGLMWILIPIIDDLFQPCAPPAQVRALTTPELLVPYRDLANRFEDAEAERDGDCRPAEIHVSAMPAARAIEGMQAEWSAEYLRDGPRPDIWLPEATMHVDRVRTTSAITRFGPRMEVTDSIGSTPIVLAVPASSGIDPKEPEWTGQTWASLIRKLQDAGIGLVRPGTSTVGEFATVAMYTTEGGAVTLRSNPDRARSIETWIDNSLKAGRYPPGGDSAPLLRRHRDLGTAGAAMAIAELDVIRYNEDVRRAARGRGCDARNGPPECLLAVYPVDTLSFDLPVALMNWASGTRSDQQQKAAADFKAWLSGKGQAEMVFDRLRPLPGTPLQPPLSEDNGVLPGGPTANATNRLTGPTSAVLAEMLTVRQGVRKTGHVLISLDASGSMRARVGGETRYSLAVKAITEANEQLAKQAEVLLQVFSATMGVRRVDLAALGQVQPVGNTPQHRAILDGMRTVGQGGTLVLLTDGNNNVDDVPPQQLAEQTGVRVLVLAFGEANCGTQVLIDVTSRTGGTCRQAGVETLSADLADLVRGV